MKKKVFEMTDEEKRRLVEVSGSIMLWVEEARSICYMAEKLNLEPWQIDSNMVEMLYVLRKCIGKRRFFKILFMK
jgi:hypothetical protein